MSKVASTDTSSVRPDRATIVFLLIALYPLLKGNDLRIWFLLELALMFLSNFLQKPMKSLGR